MAEPSMTASLTLDARDLLDPLGFDAGNACEEVLEQFAQTSWLLDALNGRQTVSVPWHGFTHPRVLLAVAVRDNLLPRLDLPDGCHLVRLGTLHNPIRLADPSGHVIEPRVHPGLDSVAAAQARNAIGKSGVRVTLEPLELERLCQAVYPKRGQGWLKLFGAIDRHRALTETLPRSSDPLLAWFVHVDVGSLVDAYARYLDDGVLGLAADLLGDRAADMPRPLMVIEERDSARALSVLDEVIASAHAVGSPSNSRAVPPVADLLTSYTPGLLTARQPAPSMVRVPRHGEQVPARPLH